MGNLTYGYFFRRHEKNRSKKILNLFLYGYEIFWRFQSLTCRFSVNQNSTRVVISVTEIDSTGWFWPIFCRVSADLTVGIIFDLERPNLSCIFSSKGRYMTSKSKFVYKIWPSERVILTIFRVKKPVFWKLFGGLGVVVGGVCVYWGGKLSPLGSWGSPNTIENRKVLISEYL